MLDPEQPASTPSQSKSRRSIHQFVHDQNSFLHKKNTKIAKKLAEREQAELDYLQTLDKKFLKKAVHSNVGAADRSNAHKEAPHEKGKKYNG